MTALRIGPMVSLSVRVREEAGTDRLGNDVLEYGPAQAVQGCLFAPTSSSDLGTPRPDGAVADAVAYLPRGWSARLRGAKVSPDGKRWYAVVGAPAEWPEDELPARWPWAVQVQLREIEG